MATAHIKYCALHRLVAYDFDRLDSDDVIGNLELDMWNIFDKNWAQEIDQSWPLRDDYGDVDKSTLKRAPPDKKDVRLPVFCSPEDRHNAAQHRVLIDARLCDDADCG